MSTYLPTPYLPHQYHIPQTPLISTLINPITLMVHLRDDIELSYIYRKTVHCCSLHHPPEQSLSNSQPHLYRTTQSQQNLLSPQTTYANPSSIPEKVSTLNIKSPIPPRKPNPPTIFPPSVDPHPLTIRKSLKIHAIQIYHYKNTHKLTTFITQPILLHYIS